jgi:hypothetical protein
MKDAEQIRAAVLCVRNISILEGQEEYNNVRRGSLCFRVRWKLIRVDANLSMSSELAGATPVSLGICSHSRRFLRHEPSTGRKKPGRFFGCRLFVVFRLMMRGSVELANSAHTSDDIAIVRMPFELASASDFSPGAECKEQ